jgi:hypothetical protein
VLGQVKLWRIKDLVGTGTSWIFVKLLLGVLRVIGEDAAVLSLRISGLCWCSCGVASL